LTGAGQTSGKKKIGEREKRCTNKKRHKASGGTEGISPSPPFFFLCQHIKVPARGRSFQEELNWSKKKSMSCSSQPSRRRKIWLPTRRRKKNKKPLALTPEGPEGGGGGGNRLHRARLPRSQGDLHLKKKAFCYLRRAGEEGKRGGGGEEDQSFLQLCTGKS